MLQVKEEYYNALRLVDIIKCLQPFVKKEIIDK